MSRVTTRENRPRLTRALRSRNYRLVFGGQSVSLVGTWITRIATSRAKSRRSTQIQLVKYNLERHELN